MKTINCPFCNNPVTIDISKAIDENGEEYCCPHCKKIFRYVNNKK